MLLVGSQNPHKIQEIGAILQGVPISVVGSDRLPPGEDVEEDGQTFSQNALIKALAYAQRAAQLDAAKRPRWVVADDSGLCVDALGGAPGVFSARYAGPEQDYAANNRKLLSALEGVPPEERRAHFVCALACVEVPAEPASEPTLCFEVEGRCDGTIAANARGTRGFGYDPLFVEPSTGATFAELSEEEKNSRSHRGDALQKFREKFLPLMSDAPRNLHPQPPEASKLEVEKRGW